MARTAIPVTNISGPRGSVTITPATSYTAADATNDHEFTHTGGLLDLYVENNSGSVMNVSIKAVAGANTKQMAEDKDVALNDGQRLRARIAYNDGYVTSTGTVEIDIDQDTGSYLAVFKVT